MSFENQAQVSNHEILSAIQHLQKKVHTTSKKQRLSETAIPLKGDGNKGQFKHADGLATLIEAALGSLELGDYTSTKASLQEALQAIKQREKLIKLTNRSPLGWATVKEYITDDLADNSDDEKRIRKAEKVAASRKTEAKKSRYVSRFRENRGFSPYDG